MCQLADVVSLQPLLCTCARCFEDYDLTEEVKTNDHSTKQPVARRPTIRIVVWAVVGLVLIPVVVFIFFYITMVDLEDGMPVDNQTAETLQIFAVNEDGSESLWNTLRPGERGVSGLRCSTPQVARTMDGVLVAGWEPSPDCSDSNTWVITSTDTE